MEEGLDLEEREGGGKLGGVERQETWAEGAIRERRIRFQFKKGKPFYRKDEPNSLLTVMTK